MALGLSVALGLRNWGSRSFTKFPRVFPAVCFTRRDFHYEGRRVSAQSKDFFSQTKHFNTGESAKKVLVVGSEGALGRDVCHEFLERGFQPIGCDVLNANERTSRAPMYIQLGRNTLLTSMSEAFFSRMETLDVKSVTGVVCVGGGFQAGTLDDPDFVKACESGIQTSIYPTVLAARAAAVLLETEGLLVLTGAANTLIPSAIGYASAKSYVHHMLRLIAEGQTEEAFKVVGISPLCLDTPGNRVAMPDADFDSWTPTPCIAAKLVEWTTDHLALKNGSIYKVLTERGVTKFYST